MTKGLTWASDDQTEPCQLELVCAPYHLAFHKPLWTLIYRQGDRDSEMESDLPHVEVAGPRRDLGFVEGLELDAGRRHGCGFRGPRRAHDNQLSVLYHTEGMHSSDAILLRLRSVMSTLSLPTLDRWGN